MQISNILSKLTQDEKSQEYFLALEISSEFVIAALWTVEEGKSRIVKVSSAKEWEDETELFATVDECISVLLADFSQKIKGLIFGLEENWIEKDNIVPERQAILKKICQKLEIKPLGFVVIMESLIQYLKLSEGMPLSAILVKLELTQATIALVKLGKVIQTETVGRSDDLSSDLKEALVRFGDVDSFPSRILLFDGLTDFEEARQQITSYDWTQLPFLHIPKVDVLERNITIKALAIAGGSEIAKSLGFEIKEEKEEKKVEKTEEFEKPEEKKEYIKEGFKDDGEVNKEEIETKEKSDEAEEEASEKKSTDAVKALALESIGFFSNEDILEKVDNVRMVDKKDLQEKSKEAENTGDSETRAKKRFGLKGILSKPAAFFAGIKKAKLASFKVKNTFLWILLPVSFLLLLFGAVFAVYWYLPKADLTLFFRAENLEQSISIKADTSAKKIDYENKVLPVVKEEKELSGSKSMDSSGTALVGEKAKGEVTIYNKTNLVKKFSADTPLVAENGLRYYLDNDVEIASKSAESSLEGENIVYGKIQAKISAAKIGPEYNLDKDTEFSVNDYAKSNFSAVASSDLSGGSSREVSAISQEDKKTLFDALKQELIAKAQTDSEANGDKESLSDTEDIEVVKEEYDKDAGDEANSLTLDMAVKVSSYVFAKNDLDMIMAGSLISLMPDGYTIESSQISEQKITQDKEDIGIDLKIKAELLPKIDIEKVKENIKGRYPIPAEDYFKSLPGFSRADIMLYPKFFPSKLQTFPRQSQRISISIKVDTDI